jgi:hypothetical protein
VDSSHCTRKAELCYPCQSFVTSPLSFGGLMRHCATNVPLLCARLATKAHKGVIEANITADAEACLLAAGLTSTL